MKVVHVITRLVLGGAQENTLLTCEGLRRRGHDVTLITGPALGPEGDLIKRANATGVPLRLVDELRRAVTPWRDLKSYCALKKLLCEIRPQIVHTHSSKAGIIGRRAAHAAGVPIIVHTIHGLPFFKCQSSAANWLYIALERRAALISDRIFCVADAMTEGAVAAGIAERSKFQTVYSGMEVEPFLDDSISSQDAKKELGIPPDAPVVGKIARLFHLKGHEDFLAAAARISKRFPSARFLIVGSGILHDKLIHLALSLGIVEKVTFAGLVPPDRIPFMVKAMDVLVHASYREGLARTLVQALLSARPVVSYDLDGAPEVVLPGKTGFLVAPGDIQGLADSVVSLLSDPKLRQRYGEQGRSLFAKTFGHETMTTQIENAYFELARQKGISVNF